MFVCLILSDDVIFPLSLPLLPLLPQLQLARVYIPTEAKVKEQKGTLISEFFCVETCVESLNLAKVNHLVNGYWKRFAAICSIFGE